jgi:hypothetical protein
VKKPERFFAKALFKPLWKSCPVGFPSGASVSTGLLFLSFLLRFSFFVESAVAEKARRFTPHSGGFSRGEMIAGLLIIIRTVGTFLTERIGSFR